MLQSLPQPGNYIMDSVWELLLPILENVIRLHPMIVSQVCSSSWVRKFSIKLFEGLFLITAIFHCEEIKANWRSTLLDLVTQPLVGLLCSAHSLLELSFEAPKIFHLLHKPSEQIGLASNICWSKILGHFHFNYYRVLTTCRYEPEETTGRVYLRFLYFRLVKLDLKML